MCLHRPAAAVGGGADGRGWRSDLTREHHCQMWQGQPLLWSVGEKPPRRGATCETRYETFDVIIGSDVGENACYFSFFLMTPHELAALSQWGCSDEILDLFCGLFFRLLDSPGWPPGLPRWPLRCDEPPSADPKWDVPFLLLWQRHVQRQLHGGLPAAQPHHSSAHL